MIVALEVQGTGTEIMEEIETRKLDELDIHAREVLKKSEERGTELENPEEMHGS